MFKGFETGSIPSILEEQLGGLMAERGRGTKSLMMKVKRESY